MRPYETGLFQKHQQTPPLGTPRSTKQRVKVWAPKSHNGCDTCKQRRIKCDETKPTCLKCLRSRRECKGYNVPKAMIFEIAETTYEKRGLAYYREKAGPAISGHFEKSLWVDILSRICYQEAVIRNCVIAVGAFHEECVSADCGHIVRPTRLSKYSVQQISKAYQTLAEQGATLSIDLFLLSTVVLVSLEELQGEYEHAIMHLRTGLKLRAQWQQNPRILPKPSDAGRALLKLHLIPLLRRLAFQYSAMDPSLLRDLKECGVETEEPNTEMAKAHRFEDILGEPELESIRVPVMFTCPLTARSILDDLVIIQVNKFNETAKKAHHDKDDHTRVRKPYLQKLKQWLQALEAGGRRQQDLSPKDADIKLLLIRFKLSLILQHAGPFASEMVWDRYTSAFDEIVSIGEETLGVRPEDTVRGRKVAMHYAYVLWPLFLTSLLCRHPQIRRKAASLLLMQTEREGIWTTNPAVRITNRVIELEESGLDIVESEADIPEHNRVCVMKMVSIKRPWQPLYRTEETPMLDFGPFLFEYTQFQSGSTTRVLKREILEDPTWADKCGNTSMEEYLKRFACIGNTIRQNCHCGAFDIQILLSGSYQSLDDDEQSTTSSSPSASSVGEDPVGHTKPDYISIDSCLTDLSPDSLYPETVAPSDEVSPRYETTTRSSFSDHSGSQSCEDRSLSHSTMNDSERVLFQVYERHSSFDDLYATAAPIDSYQDDAMVIEIKWDLCSSNA